MKYKIKVKNKYLTGINRIIIFSIINGINDPRELFDNVLNIFYKDTVIKYLSKLMNVHLICIKESVKGKGFYLNKNFDGKYYYVEIKDYSDLQSLDKKEIYNILRNNSVNKNILEALDLMDINKVL
ncbi:hypothetical protein [uncultured Brachyspira sp.]|uniref:hypothetical protein n=1 Tax=uncultured Brachyspira sp. TaxID=221953 RepID=UPI00262E1772|nr:hypothetical protein [uncultured Brachyspira sp.]